MCMINNVTLATIIELQKVHTIIWIITKYIITEHKYMVVLYFRQTIKYTRFQINAWTFSAHIMMRNEETRMHQEAATIHCAMTTIYLNISQKSQFSAGDRKVIPWPFHAAACFDADAR